MTTPQPPNQLGPVVNRLPDILLHISRYSGRGLSRLARDAGIDNSILYRLINHDTNPSVVHVMRVLKALERQLGKPIHPDEVIAEYGAFRTPFVCDLVGCPGCLPPGARDERNDMTEAFKLIKPGQWICSLYPAGYKRNNPLHA